MENYIIFESIRKIKQKGGSMLGVHVDLHPVLVSEYSDEFELLVVEGKTGNTDTESTIDVGGIGGRVRSVQDGEKRRDQKQEAKEKGADSNTKESSGKLSEK